MICGDVPTDRPRSAGNSGVYAWWSVVLALIECFDAAVGSLDALGVLAGAGLGAALGSRGLYMLQYWGALTHEPLAIWLGGKTIVGGLLGAVVGVETGNAARARPPLACRQSVC